MPAALISPHFEHLPYKGLDRKEASEFFRAHISLLQQCGGTGKALPITLVDAGFWDE